MKELEEEMRQEEETPDYTPVSSPLGTRTLGEENLRSGESSPKSSCVSELVERKLSP